MFELALTLLAVLAVLVLAIIGVGTLAMPLYFVALWRTAVGAPTPAGQAEIDAALAEA